MRPSMTIPPGGGDRFRSDCDKLMLTHADMAGPILVVVGVEHRRQQARLFASQGATGPGGRWAALNPSYAARKAKTFGKKKILQLSGEMVANFTKASSPNYVQRYEVNGDRGTYLLGAHSDEAAAHLYGRPDLARYQSGAAKRVFFGTARRLPVRDPISKTRGQVSLILLAIRDWYVDKRIPQVLRAQRGRA